MHRFLSSVLIAIIATIALFAQQRGDVNRDGKVNVTDVTTLVNMILGVQQTDSAAADVNQDTHINVSDVTALVNLIQNPPAPEPQDSICFMHISDTHSTDITLKPMIEMLDTGDCAFAVITGDLMPTTAMLNELKAATKPIFQIPGNHDSWDGLGQRGFHEQVQLATNQDYDIHYGADDACYFYADVRQNNRTLRVIGIDQYEIETVGSTHTNSAIVYSQKQIDWFIDVLEHSDEVDGIIILAHAGFGNHAIGARDMSYVNEFVSINAWTFLFGYLHDGISNPQMIPEIVEAFSTGANLENVRYSNGIEGDTITINTHFTGPHNSFIAHYAGHIHFDIVEPLPNFPQQTMAIIAYGGKGRGNDWNDLVKPATGEQSYTINRNTVNFTTRQLDITRLGSTEKIDGTFRRHISFPLRP